MFGNINKRGKLSTLLFIGAVILPLLGLLIMDYQLKQANDITGAYLVSGPSAYASENLLAGAVVLGVIVSVLVGLSVNRIRKARVISTMPLAKINDEIQSIDEHLKR
ncbi:hypothetical protein JW898_04290 [Candidatus Woesearchaeota archaeon]|nr:hypothetical protein [Candidatus Woesearchaeota archaeon]